MEIWILGDKEKVETDKMIKLITMNKEYKEFIEEDNLFEEDAVDYNASKDFITLEAWKAAREMKLFFYNSVIPKLHNAEKFNLEIQIRKAAVSSTANIAEGYGRYHYQEGIQFYRISRGSQSELKDHLISCYDLKFIEKEIYDDGLALIEKSKSLLNGYINYIQKQQKKSK